MPPERTTRIPTTNGGTLTLEDRYLTDGNRHFGVPRRVAQTLHAVVSAETPPSTKTLFQVYFPKADTTLFTDKDRGIVYTIVSRVNAWLAKHNAAITISNGSRQGHYRMVPKE